MPDEPVVAVETPPVAPPPEPAVALDPTGVPWENRVAEWKRKAETEAGLNEQYKVALGQLQQQRQVTPPAPVTDDLDELGKQFDEPTKKYVTGLIQREARKIAEETGYKFVSQAAVQNELQADPEIMAEARSQYAALNTNPLWARADDVLKQEHAVAAAKNVVLGRRNGKATQTQTKEAQFAAERGMAAAAGVPRTAGSPPPPETSKEQFVKDFMADPESRDAFSMAYGRHLNPDSPEGQKAFKEAAEIAYNEGRGGGFWGGKARVAINILGEGKQ